MAVLPGTLGTEEERFIVKNLKLEPGVQCLTTTPETVSTVMKSRRYWNEIVRFDINKVNISYLIEDHVERKRKSDDENEEDYHDL